MSPDNNPEIDRIIEDVLQRRDQGDSYSDEEVIAKYSELKEQLVPRLKQLRLIQQARDIADQAPFDETVTVENSHSRQHSKLEPGKHIRQYILLEKIGAGGFGAVWKARDSKLDCDVAIKIPRNEKLSSDEIDRFIREARVSARLRRHPNIVSVHEADWDEEIAFISSDFIEGKTLGERIAEAPLTIDEIIPVTLVLCDALHHAHKEGVVHRDLKPDNILLDKQGNPHVTDFGLAKQEHEEIEGEAGKILGTVSYMSPEQAQGHTESIDRRSDVFSLGIILYQLITGERPFRGDVINTLKQIADEDPLRPQAFDSRIPLDLETICLKCLEKNPDQRYQSLADLKDDLIRYQKNQPIKARPISAAGKVWRWCKRHPVIPLLSLSLILVTLGALITAGFMLNGQIDELQKDMLGDTQTRMNVTAFYAKQDVEQTLDKGFETVSSLVDSTELQKLLNQWNFKTDAKTRIQKINELQTLAAGNVQDDQFPLPLQPIQKFLRQRRTEYEGNLSTFSWFITDKQGHQIARVDTLYTLGKDLSHRSYFTGLPQDLSENPDFEVAWSPSEAGRCEPRMSDAFVTLPPLKANVIAISAPIWSRSPETGNIEFQGVAGIFVELGRLIEMPPEISDQESASPQSSSEIKLAIFDVHGLNDLNSKPNAARLLHHPQLLEYLETNRSAGSGSLSGNLPRADLKLNSTSDEPFIRIPEYQDPLHQGPQETWLAIRNVHPINDRLFVVVQMPASVVKAPGDHLRTKLIYLGLAVFAFATAILVPAWVVILRSVLKE